jgi:glycosyltransferase involved in cell wall biosynthesis
MQTDGIWAYVPGAIVTPSLGPVLGSPGLLHNWHRLTMPNLVRRLSARGFGNVDILYIDTVVQGFWLDAIDHRRSILRVGDRMSAFQRFGPAMVAELATLARRVDVVAHAALTLADEVERLGPRQMLHLPNGVDLQTFVAAGPTARPSEYADVGGPIAIYVGAMDEWFDFALMDQLTGALPDVTFVLIGPLELARRRLADRPNLRLLGVRPYAELPAYLRHATVGLIPFDVAGHPDLVSGIHPLKLYEYLASGLPVVATRWEELAQLDPPATTLCADAATFEAGIRGAVDRQQEPEAVNRFVAAADWRARARTLIEVLAA